MTVSVRPVVTKKNLKDFVLFPFQLYKGNQFWIPPMIKDEMETFRVDKNPSFEHCQSRQWLAEKEGQIVGRIAGITHYEETTEKKIGRFGWVDFTDDQEVSRALFSEVENWLKAQGAEKIHGPLGFTDLDFEGMLVEGFDEIGTIATIYNHNYYPEHLERLGFSKAVDWIEIEGEIPQEVPYRVKRKSEIIESRFKVRSLSFKRTKDMLPYGRAIFEVINKSYKSLYGYHALSDKQIDKYIKQYLSFVKPGFSSVIVNDKDTVIGFGITMPSLSVAFQRARGKLFPFGFLHILKALKRNSIADFYLIGVLPEYHKMGIPLLIMRDIWPQLIKSGIKKVYLNPALEDNYGILNHWLDYQDNYRVRKRRRCYIKKID